MFFFPAVVISYQWKTTTNYCYRLKFGVLKSRYWHDCIPLETLTEIHFFFQFPGDTCNTHSFSLHVPSSALLSSLWSLFPCPDSNFTTSLLKETCIYATHRHSTIMFHLKSLKLHLQSSFCHVKWHSHNYWVLRHKGKNNGSTYYQEVTIWNECFLEALLKQ